jgi:hypothetical protein
MKEFDLIEMGFKVGDTVWEMGQKEWKIAEVLHKFKHITIESGDMKMSIQPSGRYSDHLLPSFFPNRFEIPEAAFEKPRPELAVDTPIWVRDGDTDNWQPRHFAKWEGHKVVAWDEGRTSHSCAKFERLEWQQYRLTDPKEGE